MGVLEDCYSVGTKCLNLGELDDAIKYLSKCLDISTVIPEVYYNLGVAYFDKQDYKKATELFKQSIALKSDYTLAYFNLGLSLRKLQLMKASRIAYAKVVELNPTYVEAIANLAVVEQYLGNFDGSEELNKRALALNPDLALAKNNLALLLLLKDDYINGFKYYESRFTGGSVFDVTNNYIQQLYSTGSKRWSGENLEGKTLLILTEQGAGDSIMMLRYLKLLHGIDYTVYCPQSLKRLFKIYTNKVIDTKSKIVFSNYDYFIPMMSLPHLFKTTLDNIPDVDLKLTDDIPKSLDLSGKEKFKVGITWAGSPNNGDDNIRSLPKELILPLLDIPNITFVSLQKDAKVGNIMIDMMDQCSDFYSTAQIIKQLDLVISVDTAISHLAGSLNVPVWLLNRYKSEWRWGLNRTDCPWYKSMKIFRQNIIGDWNSVIERIGIELKKVT